MQLGFIYANIQVKQISLLQPRLNNWIDAIATFFAM